MKRLFLSAVIAAVFSVFLPIACGLLSPAVTPDAGSETPDTDITVIGGRKENEKPDDSSVSLTLHTDAGDTVTDMHTYLVGVVSAEMPASFAEEALKAQAIAARTYALHKMQSECAGHPDADLCTDVSCCQAYCTDGELREKWGADYGDNLEKIESAVSQTDGISLEYGGEPILAAFHASSCGRTESCAEVWGNDLPYLISVESPENGDDIPNYVSSAAVSYGEFDSVLLERYPEADVSAGRIGEVVRDGSGRISTITLGGISVPGTVFRSMFSLRSAAVEISSDENGFTFTVTGSGHGVGMSQYGANALAKQGYSCEDILAWYYPGAVMKKK